MKRDKFLSIRGKALGKKLERSELFSLQEQEDAAAGDAEALYREIIKISQTAGRQRSTQVADAKSELAWLITNFSPLHRPPTVSGTRTRVDESETLFSESLELNGQIRGIDADETLIVVIALGNLYLKYDNYEKALPFYERYIQAFEKKRGSKAPELVNALRPLAQIHYATFREGDSDAAIKRVEEITGRKENLPLGKLDLYSRSKDAVAHFLDRANSTQAKWVSNGGDRGVQAALKSVRVRTTIDTSGKVIEAVAETSDADLKKRAEAEVSKWFVRPFIYNGDARNLRGYLVYYDIR
jgi:tetratricopeptide (TPR) repeat protein